MLKFNKAEYESASKRVVNHFSEVESLADEIYAKGFKNIFFISSGGSVAQMMPLERILKNHSQIHAYLEVAGDLVLTGNQHLKEDSIVLMASKSGDTKETVAAAKYCKERGVSVISFVGSLDSTLANNSDYVVEMQSSFSEHTLMNYYILLYRLMYNNGEFPEYETFINQMKKVPLGLIEIFQKFEPEAEKIAKEHYRDDYQIWTGSGTMWGIVYLFAMCILEEMQWIRTKSVTSAEFFHGTLELVDEEVPMFLVKTTDETRPLDDRVEKFMKKYTDKGVILDPKNYEIPNVDKEFQALISPIIMSALLKRLSFHFESRTGHSLDFRRYYRKLDF